MPNSELSAVEATEVNAAQCQNARHTWPRGNTRLDPVTCLDPMTHPDPVTRPDPVLLLVRADAQA